MLQPVPVRNPDEAVQEGLRHDLQGHRGIEGDQVNLLNTMETLTELLTEFKAVPCKMVFNEEITT